MQQINLTIVRGDGPYVIAQPFAPNGIQTTATEWLAGDGAGASLRMQCRRSESNAAPVLVELKPEQLTFQDVNGTLAAVVSLRPEDTALLRDGAAADLELRRSGDRVDTLLRISFDIYEDVTR